MKFSIEELRPTRNGMTISRDSRLGNSTKVTYFSMGKDTSISQESYDRMTMYITDAGSGTFLLGEEPKNVFATPGTALIVPEKTLCGMQTENGLVYTGIIFEKENIMKKENTAIRLKTIMNMRGLRQVDILNLTVPYCQKYNVKMHKSDISQYCSGKTEPNQEKLFILGNALNVSEAWLMGFDVPMERTPYKAESVQNSSVSAQCKEIIEICNQLSPHNQRKVLAYSKNLLSAQQMEEDLLAAHARTDVEQTPEGVQHDLDIMNDDSKWEE